MQLALVPSDRPPPPSAPPALAFSELVQLHQAEWGAQDPSFAAKLQHAVNDPNLQSCGEDTKKAVRALLAHGIILNLDCSQRSVGQFVVKHLLQPTTSYDLQVTLNDGEAMTVPTQTRLTFVYLAESLGCTIFLFSNRGIPRVYRPPSGASNRVCGIIHMVDSILAHSEFIHLSFAETPSTPPILASPPPSSISMHGYTGPPPARYRSAARSRSTKRPRLVYDNDDKIRMQDALRVGCSQRLQHDVISAVEKFYKEYKDPESRDMNKASVKDGLKIQLGELATTPRNVLSNAEVEYRKQTPMPVTRTSKCLRNDIINSADQGALATWKTTVNIEFDEHWTREIQTKEASEVESKAKRRKPNRRSKETASGNPPGQDTSNGAPDVLDLTTTNDDLDEDEGDDRRTCTVSISQVLHQGLSTDDYSRIIALLEENQSYATDLVDALYTMVHKETILLAGGALYHEEMQSLSLTSILPPDIEIPQGRDTIFVAPVPNGLQASIEEKSSTFHQDVRNVFSQAHLDKLVTHFSKPTTTSSSTDLVSSPRISLKDRNDHPEWSILSEIMARESPCPPVSDRDGHKNIVSAHVRQCATNIKTLWDGSAYDKSLQHLIRYLLSAWLAPKRDAQNKERSRMHAEKAASKSTSTSDKLSRSHWRHSIRMLCNKLASCVQNDRPDGIERLTGPLRALYSKKPPLVLNNRPSVSLPSLPSDQLCEDDNDDLSHEELDRLIDEVESELERLNDDSALDRDVIMDNPDTSSRSNESTQSTHTRSSIESKESSRRTLRRLQALTKVLIESPSPKDQFDIDHVKKSVFKGSKFTEDELQVVLRITNFLRPFVPRRWKGVNDKDYRQHTHHVALDAPIVMISNAILRLLGRTDFTRRIAPHVAAGDSHGLQLGAAQLHEALCSSSPGHYDVTGAYGDITNVEDVTSPRHNKQMVFKGFFDMDKIEAICRKHGLQFGLRMVYVDRHTLHLSGPQLKDSTNRHSVKSSYEIRKKAVKGKPEAGHWGEEFHSSGLSMEQVESNIAALLLEVEAKMKAREGPRKRVAALRRDCSIGNHNVKNCTGKTKEDMLGRLKQTQHLLRCQEQEFIVLDHQWEEAKKELNYWNRVLTGARKKTKPTMNKNNPGTVTTPTWDQPNAEDTPQHVDMKEVFANHRTKSSNRTRVVVTWAEDPGVKTLSENVFLTVEGIQESVNRFHVLQDLDDDQAIVQPEPWTQEQREKARRQVQEMKIPTAHRITAKQIDEVSHGRRLRKTRERVLSEEQYAGAKDGIESASKSPLATASTLDDVTAAVNARTPVINTIRSFNKDPRLIQQRRTTRHRTKMAWARLCSNLRKSATDYTIQNLTSQERGIASVDQSTGFCSGCNKFEVGKCASSGQYRHPTHCVRTVPEVRHVAFVGAAGTGIGSRLKGNFRLGGGRIREQHRQFGTVIITDEHMTSQRCCFCFTKTRPGRARRMVDGTQKIVNLHGVKECTNPACPAFRYGYTTRPRDSQACVCIGMAGYSALDLEKKDKDLPKLVTSPKEPIAPFRSFLRPHERQRISLDPPVTASQRDPQRLPQGL